MGIERRSAGRGEMLPSPSCTSFQEVELLIWSGHIASTERTKLVEYPSQTAPATLALRSCSKSVIHNSSFDCTKSILALQPKYGSNGFRLVFYSTEPMPDSLPRLSGERRATI